MTYRLGHITKVGGALNRPRTEIRGLVLDTGQEYLIRDLLTQPQATFGVVGKYNPWGDPILEAGSWEDAAGKMVARHAEAVEIIAKAKAEAKAETVPPPAPASGPSEPPIPADCGITAAPEA